MLVEAMQGRTHGDSVDKKAVPTGWDDGVDNDWAMKRLEWGKIQASQATYGNSLKQK